MKALVVGGNGFIGSHLVDRLLSQDWEVTVFDRYERRYDSAPRRVHFLQGDLHQGLLLKQAVLGVDVVFHLAWSTIHEDSTQDPAADASANLIPSIRLIETAHREGVRRIVFLSSAGTVYGPPKNLPIPEDHVTDPISAYGITKLAVEKYLQMFGHLYGQEYVILRPSVPYGPRQNPFGRQGAVAVFLYRVGNGLPISVWGDGTVTRDFFYISDLVEAIVASAERPLEENRIFNVGGPQEISVKELLRQIEEVVGKESVVEFLPARRFDVPRILLNTGLAQSALHWRAEVPLRKGLTETWKWMSGVTISDYRQALP